MSYELMNSQKRAMVAKRDLLYLLHKLGVRKAKIFRMFADTTLPGAW